MKYEENQGYGEESGEREYRTLYLKTRKNPKYENEICT